VPDWGPFCLGKALGMAEIENADKVVVGHTKNRVVGRRVDTQVENRPNRYTSRKSSLVSFLQGQGS
jgi:hypothetical protein